MKKLILSFVLLAITALMLLSLGSCENDGQQLPSTDTTSATAQISDSNYVKITVKNYGDIILELYPDVAPITVANFKKLVSEKFYDGVTIHRVSPGFVIQGGDPDGTGLGGSKDSIKGEFSANGVDNKLSHTRGVISMARRGNDANSASSQFFIVLDDRAISSLDGLYAGFGRVIEGMDVVDDIASVTCVNEKPITDIVMETVTILESYNVIKAD